MPDLDRWVAVGSIVKPHGVRGELRVRLYNAESDVLLQVDTVRLRRQGQPDAHVNIRTARPASGGFLLIAFEGVDDRDAAEALRGVVLEVPRHALPPLDPGEFYVCDVIGAHAVLPDGTPIGTVVDFQSFPSTQVLVVEHDGRRFDVPLVDDFVQSVDVDAKRVVISSLDGLESG
jgi:16S rRNA processing protein RimM